MLSINTYLPWSLEWRVAGASAVVVKHSEAEGSALEVDEPEGKHCHNRPMGSAHWR